MTQASAHSSAAHRTPAHSSSDEIQTGTVKWFNDKKGYGFIGRDGQRDMFVHRSALKDSGISAVDFTEGKRVSFSVRDDRGGNAAVNIKFL